MVTFVRGVDSSFNITEGYPLKGNCMGTAVFKEIDTSLIKVGLTNNRLVRITTDSAAVMISKEQGLRDFIQRKLESPNMNKGQIWSYHCILH